MIHPKPTNHLSQQFQVPIEQNREGDQALPRSLRNHLMTQALRPALLDRSGTTVKQCAIPSLAGGDRGQQKQRQKRDGRGQVWSSPSLQVSPQVVYKSSYAVSLPGLSLNSG